MKKIISLLITLAIAVTAAAQSKSHCINVNDFGALKVVDGINVVYRCNADSAGMAVFTCEPDVAPMIMFSNNKNTLKIELQTNGINVKNLPVITVYSNFLASVENSSDSTVTVHAPAPGAEIKLVVIGNGCIKADNLHATTVIGRVDAGKGHLVLNGNTQWAKLRTIGTGKIEAGGLKASKGSLTMSGTGDIDCCIDDDLTVTGLGTGKVYVKGTPKVKNRTLGSVKVINVE